MFCKNKDLNSNKINRSVNPLRTVAKGANEMSFRKARLILVKLCVSSSSNSTDRSVSMEEQSDHRSVGDAGEFFAVNDFPALALTRFNSRSEDG